MEPIRPDSADGARASTSIDCRRLTGCRRWIKRGCLGSIFVLLLALLGLHLYFSSRRAAAEKEVEAVLAALRADGIPVTPEELDAYYPHVPDEENAALVYMRAFEKMVEPDLEAPVDPEHPELGTMGQWLPFLGQADFVPGQEVPPLMWTAIDTCLAQNAEALDLLHEAGGYEKCRFPLQFASKFLLEVELEDLRLLGQGQGLLMLQTLKRSTGGSAAGSVKAIAAVFAVGRALDSEPLLVSGLISLRTNSTALQAIENLLCRSALAAEELDRLLLLVRNCHNEQRITDSLPSEFVAARQGFARPRELLRTIERMDLNSLLPLYEYTGRLASDQAFALRWLRSARNVCRYPVAERAVCVWALTHTLDSVRGVQSLLFINGRLISRELLAGIDRALMSEAREAVRSHVCLVALHLEKLRLPTGIPESLDAVAAAYPDLSLTDPFDGQRLRYRRLEEGGYVVYSVGEDRVDDGGDPKAKRWGGKDVVFAVTR